MKRLTGWDYIAGVKTGDILNGIHEQVAFDRLAQIEDIHGDEYDLDRLKELVEADKDGRCVVLPCKVGDKIYKLFGGDVTELQVERIVCWSSGYWKVNAHTEYSRTDWKGFEIDFSDFGKTVFLTREAAEAALKAEARGDKH